MRMSGKLWGTLIGLFSGGFIGMGVGFVLGHIFDLFRERTGHRPQTASPSRTRQVFFRTTFAVMGHLAKADGQVSRSEIAAATMVMREMRLSPQRQAEARNLFREGKAPDFDLDAAIGEFNAACGRRIDLKIMFLQIQLHAVWADGEFSESERQILLRVAHALGIPNQVFHQIEAMVSAFARRAHGQADGSVRATMGEADLRQSCAILGVSPEDDDEQIKRAYRKLMNQHHPDKLIAKGLPEDMMEVATRRAAEIQNAYDVVKRARAARAG